MIWISSDTHFGHNRPFLYEPRGYENIQDMDQAIVSNWNSVVKSDDEVYLLGDVMLMDSQNGIKRLNELNGNIHIIRGNHDTDNRIKNYLNPELVHNVVEVCEGKFLPYKKYHFFLSHFPSLTANLDKESIKQMTLNLHGHTHSKDKFFNDLPYCYNVALEAHNCYPVALDQIIEDIKNKFIECKQYDSLC